MTDTYDDIDLTPEFDEDAEIALIGGVMRSRGRAVDDLQLTGDQFGNPAIGAAYDRAVELYRADGFVDFVHFGASLNVRPILGVKAHHLVAAEQRTPTVAAVMAYEKTILDWATKRAVRDAGTWAQQYALTASSTDALVDEARARMDAACTGTTTEVVTVGGSIYDTLADLEREDVHTPTPWPELDRFIAGLRPGALYVVGARPGKGKTVIGAMLALSMARHGRWAAFTSLEMSRHELNRRWIAQAGRVSMTAMESRRMTPDDWAAASDVASQLASLPIAIDDRGTATVWDVRHHARSVARRGQLGVVVVDYLQLMNAPAASAKKPRQEQVSEMSRALKQLARDLNVPVIALSQLNRASESRTDKRPMMSDLRESGAVEQDADVIMLLHRDEDEAPQVLEVGVAKNRHGQTGAARLRWEGEFARATSFPWSPANVLDQS